MKKKIFIIVLILFLVTISTICVISKDKIFKQRTNEEPNVPVLNNTIIQGDATYIEIDDNVIKDKNTGNIIYDTSQDYSTHLPEQLKVPKEFDEGYITEYLKYFFFVYPEQSFTSFTDDVIATIVSLASNLYEPRTTEYVQEIAKRYFDIDNYELPVDTYKLEKYGNYTVSKKDNFYFRSNITNFQTNELSAFMTDFQVVDNKIKVYYNFATDAMFGGCYSIFAAKEENEKCIQGTYIIELTYTKESLNVETIKYTSNPNYNK